MRYAAKTWQPWSPNRRYCSRIECLKTHKRQLLPPWIIAWGVRALT
jgi:hypothetical protein